MNKRIAELEAFVKKFLDNFEACKHCLGKGVFARQGVECRVCHGTGKQIASMGVLYVELPDEARTILNKAGNP